VHGLTRALVFNAVYGVTTRLEERTRHRPALAIAPKLKGKGTVVFTLGYSHQIELPLPSGIEVDRRSQADAPGLSPASTGRRWARWPPTCVRCARPDPYKNKGVRYSGEKLKKKAGKTGSK